MEDAKEGKAAKTVEAKRSKRDRKKVTLLSSEYRTIYDDAYNRKSKKQKPESDKKKEIVATEEKNVEEFSSATYQWIGEGETKDGAKGNLFFDAIEIKVGGHPALIEVGDDVLLSSYDTEESDFFDKTAVNRNIVLGSEKVDKTKIAMNGLKPFVGKVESMWEEGAGAGKKKDSKKLNETVNFKDDRRNRMKVLVRWYYKRDDLVGLKGTFDEIPRQKVLSLLRPRDLLLSETRDENEVNSILGKCSVIRRKPDLLKPTSDSNTIGSSKRSREGAFVCKFDISIALGSKTKVTITPYDGPEEEEDLPPSKRSRTNSYGDSDMETIDTVSAMAAESVSMDEATSNNAKSDDESSLEEGMKELRENKPPTTEGSATQKIMVGEKHQAVIPPFVAPSEPVVASRRDVPPTRVWKPNCISDDELDKFIDQAGVVLKAYMKERDVEMNRKVPLNIDPKHLKSKFTCREFNMDQILKLLHDKNYNPNLALKTLRASPQSYLMIWTKEDKELYNAGFKRHFSAIRFISKDMGLTKKDKEVVDYHYRFKIPDQFRRYQDKKREQARRMLEVVENHRLGGYLSTETAQAVSNATNSTKKIHNWSRTGGGPPNTIGSTEARRLGAKDFLIALKDTVGIAHYLTLVDHLKSLHLRVITIPQCRETFQFHLKEHPDLLKRFDDYLPEKFR